MNDIFSTVKDILRADPLFIDDNDRFLVSNLRVAAHNLEHKLINMLLDNALTRSAFFDPIGGHPMFNAKKFIEFVDQRSYFPDSYTRFKNKIGLVDERNDFIANTRSVSLVFPYKDCVLKGGQTQDDQKRREIFYNTTLAPDEIDRLLDPKALVNARRYSPDGVSPALEFRAEDNLIVKGNNLLALASILERYEGRVKLIYIDPPYNTGSDSFGYNDRFNHSTWLTFMKNRLEIARRLLRSDGSIFIQCDDNEAHYLKVLCDEIFGRENFIATVVWEKKYSPQNDAKYLSDSHDFILVCAKNKKRWRPNLLPRTDAMNSRYKNPDNDPRGVWKSDNLSAKRETASDIYPITTPSGRIVYPPKGASWRVSPKKFNEMVADNRIWFGFDGNNVPSIKRFLSEVQQGSVSKTIWSRDEVGDNQEAKRELLAFDFDEIFSTPKPERLLQRILQLATVEGDLVLDFFMGSATTAAVALKMRRRFIGIEQMNYIETVSIPRLRRVLEGDQSGISKAVGWTGGGSFVCCELATLNQKFVDEIMSASDEITLRSIRDRIVEKGYIDYRVNPSELKNLNELALEEQKQILMEIMDKNMMYVNASDIDDAEYALADEDKQFNRSFYGSQC